MIFIGRNFDISIPYYYNHHKFSKYRYKFLCKTNLLTWWNKLKEREPIWGILEWNFGHRKGVCIRCIHIYLHDSSIYWANGVVQTYGIKLEKLTKLVKKRGVY